MRPRTVLALALWLLPAALAAQAVQNATLQRAIQAYENLDFGQVIVLARRSLGERLTAPERARAQELLGFAYSATSQPDSAISAFREAILLDPDRQLDPRRTSPKISGYFAAALGQVLVVRQLRVDSTTFVGGSGGGLPITFTVTSPARVRTRAVSGDKSVLIDSSVVVGSLNLRWPATLPNGDPVPPGKWTIMVDAIGSGQNTFSASQAIQITQGAVDTLPHLSELPGYSNLPETEVPPRSARPLALAAMYTGLAGVGVLGLNNGSLGAAPSREILSFGVAALVVGTIFTMKKPVERPVPANIQFNQLLREQLTRRNADIAQQNIKLRQQVKITVVPLPKGAR